MGEGGLWKVLDPDTGQWISQKDWEEKPSAMSSGAPEVFPSAAAIQLVPSAVKKHSIFNFQNLSDDALFWLVLLRLAKDDPGRVERILTVLFKGVHEGMDSYCRAAAGNRIAAWGAGRLLSLQMERFGMITREQAMDFASGISVIAGAQVTTDLAALLPWTFGGGDSSFPDKVHLGDKSSSITLERSEYKHKKAKD